MIGGHTPPPGPWDLLDRGWATLRRSLAVDRPVGVVPPPPPSPAAEGEGGSATPAAPFVSRTLRLAQILDFVGQRAFAEGRTREQCLVLCRRTAHQHALGQLSVTLDETTGRVSDVAI